MKAEVGEQRNLKNFTELNKKLPAITSHERTLIWSIVVIGKSLIPEGHIKDCKQKREKKKVSQSWTKKLQISDGLNC